MDDAPWMPPGSNVEPSPDAAAQDGAHATAPEPSPDAGAPRLPAPVLPQPTSPTPPTPPVSDAAGSPWSRNGDETVLVPTLPPATPPVAAPVWPAADPFTAGPAAAPFGQADVAPGAPPVDPVPPSKRSRSKVVVGAAVVGVLAVGAAGVFAVQNIGGDSSSGGAATPEELGAALMTAIENEDVLGMIDVLSPGERDVFRQPMIDLVSELTRLEVLAPEADLGKIEGFDIVLENEVVTPESTNVPDIVNIQMYADSTVTVDGAAVPVGALVTDNMSPDDVEDMRAETQTIEEPFDGELTAVQIDERWYFSLFFTAAESLRSDAGFDEDLQIPVEGIGAVGAESPEAAMNQLLDSVQALDLRLMMQTLNPGEAAALQRYAPLFLDEAEAALDEIPLTWAITTREFRVEGDGDSRTVFVDALAIEGDIDGETFSVSVDGDCLTAEAGGESIEQCAGETIADEQFETLLDEIPDVKAFVDALSETLADVEPIGLELRQFDGQWYVSPISTFSEAMLKVLRALDRDEIDRLIELGELAAEEGFDAAFGGFGGLTEDELSVVEDVVADEMSFDDMSFDASFESSSEAIPAAASDACYSEFDAAAAAACFQQYVASGELDPFTVPIELRFPECGYGARWNGDLYSMDDATFIATIDAARPCFLALVESGQIEEYELPTELLYPECFEGRNWYNTFDDPEYDERYYACIDAAAAAG